MRRSAVITGMGVVCSAGGNVEQFTKSIISGNSFLTTVKDDCLGNFDTQVAGLVQEIDSEALQTAGFGKYDRHVQLAFLAAEEALKSSGLDTSTEGHRVGLMLGTCSGPMLTIEDIYRREATGDCGLSKEQLFAKQYYSASLLLASHYRIQGPLLTVTTACSAFAAAVTAACDLIEIGMLDSALVGGTDSFSATILAGFIGLKATSSKQCAPFSRPAGLNLGEGAGFIVLEGRKHARSRGAVIIGEVLGYGLSNDAYHSSAPDPAGKGAVLSMHRALKMAEILPEQVRYINAHGTGTEANDKAETRAIKKVFGDLAQSIPVSSSKSVVGHCLGAAGAVETVATLICAQKGVYPPTVNYTVPREGCTLDYIPDNSRSWKQSSIFLKNNFAFGGNNASLVISTDKEIVGQCDKPGRKSDPVCITGIGIISPAGIGLGCLNSKEAVVVCEKTFSGRGTLKIAQVPSFELSSIDRKIYSRGMDRSGKMATAAAALALKQASISERHSARAEIGFYMNIAQGSTWAEGEHIKPLLRNNFQIDQINAFPYIVPNSITGTVCRSLQLTGYNNTFCNGPGAGLFGLGMAWAALENGHAPAFLCGTADDLGEPGLIDCIYSEIDDPSQIIAGEGSAMMLLEPLSRAVNRGVDVLGIIKKVDFFTDSSCMFDQKAGSENLKNQIKRVLFDAEIDVQQIDTVCCNSWRSIEMNAIKENMGNVDFTLVDTSSQLGFAPSSSPLFNIATALSYGFFGEQKSKKYILTIFSSLYGMNCIVIIEKHPEMKELF